MSKRKKTPTILQMEAAECGAASLAIILAYLGKYIPLEKLRYECGVSRDGSKASNMLKAARRYGLQAKGYKKEPEDLKDMVLPAILFWNFNHFVVLEGFHKGYVYINDPASGPRKISYSELDKSFTGVVLTFEKGETFEKSGKPPSMAASLKKRLFSDSASSMALSYVVLAGLFLVIPGVVIPVFSRLFIDHVLIDGRIDWVRTILTGMAITMVFRGILEWLQQYYLLRFETKLALTMAGQFFWHILRLPISYFSQRFSGEISTRVAINDTISNLISGKLAITIVHLFTMVFYAGVMFSYDVTLTVISLIMVGLNIFALYRVSRIREDGSRKLVQDMGKLHGVTMGGLQAIETLKATGSESDFFAKWAGYEAKTINARQALQVPTTYLDAVPPLLMTINTAAILTVGSLQVMDGVLTMGMLTAYQSLMASFMKPVNSLVSLGSSIQAIKGDMRRLDDVLVNPIDETIQRDEKRQQDANKPEQSKLQGAVELNNVTFGYNRLEPPLIENFSLRIEPGQRVALVGMSGSGKSTIAKLVSGVYTPWEGEILFDDKPVEKIDRGCINSSVACVDQDVFLYEGSISDNLSIWDHTITEQQLVRAGRDAMIHDDIVSREGGYDNAIGEGGNNFSGGQRQRLEIARALVLEPSILILDEATSALDAQTEKEIDENLRKRGCTCIIVAHRLSTIRDCDEIILMQFGKVRQRGTHDELLLEDGPYSRLIKD
ncbi:MAG: NHLP family bacteriocin export ABC transporter peptidase/permease/ATPase subunit [Desulfobacterales bacterium]|nr:NHLP family bacteriocin export ABC transporter peptidase/permease/ATPase subunit [Desulfobacterales bacterium]